MWRRGWRDAWLWATVCVVRYLFTSAAASLAFHRIWSCEARPAYPNAAKILNDNGRIAALSRTLLKMLTKVLNGRDEEYGHRLPLYRCWQGDELQQAPSAGKRGAIPRLYWWQLLLMAGTDWLGDEQIVMHGINLTTKYPAILILCRYASGESW